MATETLKSWSEVESDQNENVDEIEDTTRYIDCVCIGGEKDENCKSNKFWWICIVQNSYS